VSDTVGVSRPENDALVDTEGDEEGVRVSSTEVVLHAVVLDEREAGGDFEK
jgi:hypothetical protein